MKKIFVFTTISIIVLVLIGGCVSQSSSQKSVVAPTPIPTLKTQFNVNEPATDGNLRITVIDVSDQSYPNFDSKTKWITLKLENLNSGKEIQILGSDFKLIDGKGNEYSNGGFRNQPDRTKFRLNPNQREQVQIGWGFAGSNTNLESFNKLKFDFSGSGGNTGSSIIYFNL
jgi:hypothetical protein